MHTGFFLPRNEEGKRRKLNAKSELNYEALVSKREVNNGVRFYTDELRGETENVEGMFVGSCCLFFFFKK